MSSFASPATESKAKDPIVPSKDSSVPSLFDIPVLLKECSNADFEATIAALETFHAAAAAPKDRESCVALTTDDVKLLLSARLLLPDFDDGEFDDYASSGASNAADAHPSDLHPPSAHPYTSALSTSAPSTSAPSTSAPSSSPSSSSSYEECTKLTLTHVAAHSAISSPSSSVSSSAIKLLSLILSADRFEASTVTAGYAVGHTVLTSALDSLTDSSLPPSTVLPRLQACLVLLQSMPTFNVNQFLSPPPPDREDDYVPLCESQGWSPAVMLLQTVPLFFPAYPPPTPKALASLSVLLNPIIAQSSSSPADLTMMHPTTKFCALHTLISLLDPANGLSASLFSYIMIALQPSIYEGAESRVADTVKFLLSGSGRADVCSTMAPLGEFLSTNLPPTALSGVRGHTVFDKLLLFDASVERMRMLGCFEHVAAFQLHHSSPNALRSAYRTLLANPHDEARSDRILTMLCERLSKDDRISALPLLFREHGFDVVGRTLGSGLTFSVSIKADGENRHSFGGVKCCGTYCSPDFLGVFISGYIQSLCDPAGCPLDLRWLLDNLAVIGSTGFIPLALPNIVLLSDARGNSGVNLIKSNAGALVAELGEPEIHGRVSASQWYKLARVASKDGNLPCLNTCVEGLSKAPGLGESTHADFLSGLARLCFDYRCRTSRLLVAAEDEDSRSTVVRALFRALREYAGTGEDKVDKASGFTALHELCRTIVEVGSAGLDKERCKHALCLACCVIGDDLVHAKSNKEFGERTASSILEEGGEELEWAREVLVKGGE